MLHTILIFVKDDPQTLHLGVQLPDGEGEECGERDPGQVGDEEEARQFVDVQECDQRDEDKQSLEHTLYRGLGW